LAWEVIVLRDAERVLGKVPRDLRQRMIAAIDALAITPRPHGCRKLTGYENLYRVRVGDWRIIYAIEDARLVVLILEVAPRGGAYKGL
jgi:mRNA interferase RelE/StbE